MVTTTLLAYLVFCPAHLPPAYDPTTCEWIIKGGHFAGTRFSSHRRDCDRVLFEGHTPYGRGKIVIMCGGAGGRPDR
jgi:hypothetical protein